MRRTVSTGLLLSSLFITAAAYASSPADDANASPTRISTGVTPPQMLNPLVVEAPDSFSVIHYLPANDLVTVTFTVDESGQPRDIQVLKGADPYWNARVAHAVEGLHYRPASLDDRPIAMEVKLNVNLQQ